MNPSARMHMGHACAVRRTRQLPRALVPGCGVLAGMHVCYRAQDTKGLKINEEIWLCSARLGVL